MFVWGGASVCMRGIEGGGGSAPLPNSSDTIRAAALCENRQARQRRAQLIRLCLLLAARPSFSCKPGHVFESYQRYVVMGQQ